MSFPVIPACDIQDSGHTLENSQETRERTKKPSSTTTTTTTKNHLFFCRYRQPLAFGVYQPAPEGRLLAGEDVSMSLYRQNDGLNEENLMRQVRCGGIALPWGGGGLRLKIRLRIGPSPAKRTSCCQRSVRTGGRCMRLPKRLRRIHRVGPADAARTVAGVVLQMLLVCPVCIEKHGFFILGLLFFSGRRRSAGMRRGGQTAARVGRGAAGVF